MASRRTAATIALGAGDIKPLDLSLAVADVAEAVTVLADVSVIDTTSAKLGVNVSPEEVKNLPVNGRNFANLMTLATGATTDGNGGWASVRFNGKSNQQNYLNYDGVDGSYVWDASPGYLNATGSQFRLQTSMESIAEFRVNSGLAPAESGLGAGGNITVDQQERQQPVQRVALQLLPQRRARFGEQVRRQEAGARVQPVRRLARRADRAEQDVLLRQLRGAEADDRPELHRGGAERRGDSADSGRRAGRQRRRDRARRGRRPSRRCWPASRAARSRPRTRCWRSRRSTRRPSRPSTRISARVDHRFTNSQSLYARLLYSDGEVDTPDRTVTPRRVLATQQPLNVVFNHQSLFGTSVINELRVGFNRPKYDAIAFGPAGYDPTQVSLSGTVTSQSIDARGTTGVARSGLLVRATSNASTNGQAYNPRSISLSDALTISRGAHTFKFGGEYRNIESQFQFLGSTEITYAGINEFIDNRPTQVAVSLDSPVFTPQQYYAIGFAQDTWRVGSRLTLELGLRYDFYSVVKEKDGKAKPFFIEENDFGTDPDNFYNPDKNNFSPRLSAVYQLTRQDRAARRLRALLRPRPVRGSHPADRELHRAAPRAVDRRRRQRAGVSGRSRRSIATCSRCAATRTSGPTSTTSSTAPACRRSCPAR